jgi:tRNA nucleotidyltransferase (CCA-adding enzyme)
VPPAAERASVQPPARSSSAGLHAADPGAYVLARLRELPGGPRLLELAAPRADVELVGGAVRDLLLDLVPRELDVVVAGAGASFGAAAALFARALASRLDAPASVSEHERFGTALLDAGDVRVDVAAMRAESYAAPGALPDVRPGGAEQDLLRRDFTINAIAVRLGGPARGELREAPHALADLRAGRLRVLHDLSFTDDPTRLLRLARYRGRLGFRVEPHTAALADAALAADALRTVSGPRVGAELRLALAEPDAVGALRALDELGVLAAVHPRLRFDEPPIVRALDLLPPDGRAEVLLLAALLLGLALRADARPRAEIGSFLHRIEIPHAERERALAAAVAVPRLLDELERRKRPSQLHAALAPLPIEGVALAGALAAGPAFGPDRTGAPRPGGDGDAPPRGAGEAELAVRRWLGELRHVRLRITGEDLLAAGVPQGPEIGRRLRATLALRLDGEIAPGRDAELAAALRDRDRRPPPAPPRRTGPRR